MSNATRFLIVNCTTSVCVQPPAPLAFRIITKLSSNSENENKSRTTYLVFLTSYCCVVIACYVKIYKGFKDAVCCTATIITRSLYVRCLRGRSCERACSICVFDSEQQHRWRGDGGRMKERRYHRVCRPLPIKRLHVILCAYERSSIGTGCLLPDRYVRKTEDNQLTTYTYITA